MPVSSQSADKVFCIHTLEHVNDYQGTLREIERVLRPSGEVTIVVPHQRFEWLMGRLHPEYFSPTLHQRVITLERLKQDLESRNFKVVSEGTRDFWSALYITLTHLLHRKLLKDREIEPYSGHLISQDGIRPVPRDQKPGKAGLSKLKKAILLLLDSKPPVPFLDRSFPFETYLVARKKVPIRK